MLLKNEKTAKRRSEEQAAFSRLGRRLPAQSPCRLLTYGTIALETPPADLAGVPADLARVFEGLLAAYQPPTGISGENHRPPPADAFPF